MPGHTARLATPVELSLARSAFGAQARQATKPTHHDIPDPGQLASARRTWACAHHQKGLTPQDIEECAVGYRNYLLNRITKQVGHHDPQLPEQILQDAFIKLQKAAHNYDPELANELTYLIRIVDCTVIDDFRRRKCRKAGVSTASFDEIQLPAAERPSIDSDQRAQLATALQEISTKLPPEMQKLIALQMLGLTLREISEELSEPLGTIKSRWSRTLARLRESPLLLKIQSEIFEIR